MEAPNFFEMLVIDYHSISRHIREHLGVRVELVPSRVFGEMISPVAMSQDV